MKTKRLILLQLCIGLAVTGGAATVEHVVPSTAHSSSRPVVVYESAGEFFATPDCNGDGIADIVLVDKAAGMIRAGLHDASGALQWLEPMGTDLSGITGCAVGPFLDPHCAAIALAQPDERIVAISSISSSTLASKSLPLSDAAVNALVGLDIGRSGDVPQCHDLIVAANAKRKSGSGRFLAALIPNSSNHPVELRPLLSATVEHTRGNPVSMKKGQPSQAAFLAGDSNDHRRSLCVYDIIGGAARLCLALDGLDPQSRFVSGNLSEGVELAQLVVYQPGSLSLRIFQVAEKAPSQFTAGPAMTYSLGAPLEHAIILSGKPDQLLILFEGGTWAALYAMDSQKALELQDRMDAPSGTRFTSGGIGGNGGLAVLSAPNGSGRSDTIRHYKHDGHRYALVSEGKIPELAAHHLRKNLMFFTADPFLDPAARLVGARWGGDWTSKANLAGRIFTAESFQGPRVGLRTARGMELTGVPIGAAFVLANQIRRDIAFVGTSLRGAAQKKPIRDQSASNDRDVDGIPDSWEYALFGDLDANKATGNFDPTADRMASGNTDSALDPSVIRVEILRLEGELLVRWQMAAASDWVSKVTLETSSDLVHFEAWPEAAAETKAGEFESRLPSTESQHLFIRLRLR